MVPNKDKTQLKSSYIQIFVVQIDDQTKRPAPHGFCRNEGILKSRLSLGWHYSVQRKSCEILDVKLVVLRITK